MVRMSSERSRRVRNAIRGVGMGMVMCISCSGNLKFTSEMLNFSVHFDLLRLGVLDMFNSYIQIRLQ